MATKNKKIKIVQIIRGQNEYTFMTLGLGVDSNVYIWQKGEWVLYEPK